MSMVALRGVQKLEYFVPCLINMENMNLSRKANNTSIRETSRLSREFPILEIEEAGKYRMRTSTRYSMVATIIVELARITS